jgi:hypothetical protein
MRRWSIFHQILFMNCNSIVAVLTEFTGNDNITHSILPAILLDSTLLYFVSIFTEILHFFFDKHETKMYDMKVWGFALTSSSQRYFYHWWQPHLEPHLEAVKSLNEKNLKTSNATRGWCYDFAEKFGENFGVFLIKLMLVFEKKTDCNICFFFKVKR